MQIFNCVSSSGALFAQVIIPYTRTPGSVLPIPQSTNDNLQLMLMYDSVTMVIPVIGLVWWLEVSQNQSKNIPRLAGVYVTVPFNLVLNAAESICYHSRECMPCHTSWKMALQSQGALKKERPEHWNILIYAFNSFYLPTYLSIP